MMNTDPSRSPPMASDKSAARDFFYTNLRIQEALTTIRFGIEARKGLIVVTGDSGIGKTTLLHKVAVDLPANVTCIIGSESRISFADVLRLILRNLDSDATDESESALTRHCKLQLRSRLERCEIVTLFVDDAHHLPDRTLRHIMENFLGGSAENPDGALLQLVLAGRPELKTKLLEAALIPLRRRKPILCELGALTSIEVGSYIEQSSIANDRQADRFDARAVKRIALYSKGNPLAVNLLCARALQLAGPKGAITAELIEGAAGSIDLKQYETVKEKKQETFVVIPDNSDDSDYAAGWNVAPGDFAPDKGPVFPSFPEKEQRRGGSPRSERRTFWVQGVLALIILVSVAGVIRTEAARSMLGQWSQSLKRIALTPQRSRPEVAGVATEPPKADSKKIEPPKPPPVASDPKQSAAIPGQESSARIPSPTDPPRPDGGANDTRRDLDDSAPVVAPQGTRARPAPLQEAPIPQSADLQTRVAKAIENRAIMGVQVSVVRGTAYLDGHVASERQRRAAERAARSVAGVERVQNRIAITFG